MATRARMTAEDFWASLDEDDRKLELVDGQIVEMPLPGALHGLITGRIHYRVADHVARHGGGEVLVGDTGFILRLPGDPDRVRGPDVSFISGGRLPEGGLSVRFFEGAPDLAVDVLSPSDRSADVQQKVRDFLDAGSRLVWVVAPQARTVTVYRADGSARFLREQDTLEGEDILPGLAILLKEIFL